MIDLVLFVEGPSEKAGEVATPLPASAAPLTRQLLRLFDQRTSLPQDQMQKFLRAAADRADRIFRTWQESRRDATDVALFAADEEAT